MSKVLVIGSIALTVTLWGGALWLWWRRSRVEERAWLFVAAVAVALVVLAAVWWLDAWWYGALAAVFAAMVARINPQRRVNRLVRRFSRELPIAPRAEITDLGGPQALAVLDLDGREYVVVDLKLALAPRSVLAFTIAHEVAHLALNHVRTHVALRSAGNLLTIAAAGVMWAVAGPWAAIANAGLGKLLASREVSKYSKAQEFQADALAAWWCLQEGIDPLPGAQFLLHVAPDALRVGVFGMLTSVADVFTGTHPPSRERVERVLRLREVYRTEGPEAAWELVAARL